MALFEVRYYSETLMKCTGAFVIVPDSAPAPFHVMYLLHGLSDDYSIWMRHTAIERYANDYGMMVVMPDGGRSFYADAKEGYQYETALRVELAEKLERWHPTAQPWCTTGLSMGGYGAFLFALRDPERFASASSHSGALEYGSHPVTEDTRWSQEMRYILGENPVGGPYDLFALADKKPNVALRFDCGTDDFLLDANRNFRDHLAQIGFDHTYEEFPGAHSWAYWDEHVVKSLEFHQKHLDL
jgi:S-formylglutathione hydrolase FrmB